MMSVSGSPAAATAVIARGRQAVRRNHCAGRHRLVGEGRRGSLPGRRERFRQIDADQDHRRGSRARPRWRRSPLMASIIRGLTPHQAKSLGIQVIFQDLSLFPNLTVLENIAIDLELGGALRPAPRQAMRSAAAAALARIDASLPLDARVGALPVAQRQLVAICRGLAVNARLLIMDEPTSSLTRHEVELLLDNIRRLKALGVAVVFVSHRLEEVVEIAERVTVLRDGRNVGTFPAAEVNDQSSGRVDDRQPDRAPYHRPHLDESPTRPSRSAARHASANSKMYLSRCMPGEVLGLVGLLGAGRTELALALFGMSPLDRGEILVEGRPVSLASNRAAIAAGIAYVSEDRLALGVNLRQSIADNISPGRPRTPGEPLRPCLFRAAGQARCRLDPSGSTSRPPEWRLPCTPCPAAISSVSSVGKWLATEPKILILDGPTVGVDIRNKQGILRDHPRSRSRRRGDPPDLGRNPGGLLQLQTAFCTCALAGLSANSFPVRRANRRLRRRSMRSLATAVLRPHGVRACRRHPARWRRSSRSPRPIFSPCPTQSISSKPIRSRPFSRRVCSLFWCPAVSTFRLPRRPRSPSISPPMLATRYGFPALPSIALACILGDRARQPQRPAHLPSQGRVDHRHHRNLQHLLRAAHLFHRRHRDLQPSRLVVGAGRLLSLRDGVG